MPESTRRGRRGREQRRASVKKSTLDRLPYIQNRIPFTELLSTEALEIIEHNADTILEEIGIEFRGDAEALDIWRDAGAEVQGERVRIPRGMARSLCGTAPAHFTMHARNSKCNIEIGKRNLVFAPVGGAPFVEDMDNGRRYGTIEDFTNLVKLSHSSPAIHHSGFHHCEPTNVAVNKRHLDMTYALLRYSDRPFMGVGTHPARATDCIEMAEIVFGSGFLQDHVVMNTIINVNSPLVMDETMSESLKVYTRKNQAPIITPALLAGAMGPVTAAGCLAQLLAEVMACIAFTQLINPGSPVVFGSFLGAVSMRSGAPVFGTPESLHMLFGAGQLARRLGVPFRTGGALCSAKVPDFQAGQESTAMMYATAMSGANLVHQGAGWLDGGLCASFEKFVIDADHLIMVQRFCEGIDISENAQALDAIREVGPGSHFLGAQHTQNNFKSAFCESAVWDTGSYEQWLEDGSQTAAQRANKIWKKTLKDYEAPDIDVALDEALLQYVAEKKASVPDSYE